MDSSSQFDPQFQEDQQLLQNQPTTTRKVFSRIGLACFLILIVTTALQLVAKYLVHKFAPQIEASSWFIWALVAIPMYLFGVPAGIAVFRRIPTVPFLQRSLHIKDLLIFLLMCFPVMYLGSIIGTFLSKLVHFLVGTEMQNPLDSFISGSSMGLCVLVLVILAPIFEEFVFRKLIIDRIRPYGEGICVLVSALMFGLFHGNLSQCFYAFGVGAIFAFIYVKTGKLRYSISLHMVINLLGGVVAPYLVRRVDLNSLTRFGQQNPDALLAYMANHLMPLLMFALYIIVYLGLVIAGFVLLITRRRAFSFDHGPLQPERGHVFKTLFVNWGMALFGVGVLAMFVLSVL